MARIISAASVMPKAGHPRWAWRAEPSTRRDRAMELVGKVALSSRSRQ
jgi:hypothetical protein